MNWNLSKWLGRGAKADRRLDDVAVLIARWEIVAEPDCLRVRPTGDELTPADMSLMTDTIGRLDQTETAMRIVFDFSGVQNFGPSWTPIVASLVQIARRFPKLCQIVGLHGQPAAAVDLYRNNKTLMGMFSRRTAA